jgi:hypothetical protein
MASALASVQFEAIVFQDGGLQQTPGVQNERYASHVSLRMSRSFT